MTEVKAKSRPHNFVDLTGQRFGMLTVLKPDGSLPTGTIQWLCLCDCGKQHRSRATKLKTGWTSHCGCQNSNNCARASRRRAEVKRATGAPLRVSLEGTVQLTRGLTAIVDPADIPLVSPFFWRANNTRKGFYAAKSSKPFLMHVFLLGTRDGYEIDHINGNKLDNRRSNLRWATTCQNQANRPGSLHGTSEFKGVSWLTRSRRWVAQIRANGVSRQIGTFISETDAVRAYDNAARQLHGEFAHLNFPGEL